MTDMHDWQDTENAGVGLAPVHQSEGTAAPPRALADDEAANLPTLFSADDTVEAVLARQLSAGISAALAPTTPAVIAGGETLTVADRGPDPEAAAMPKDDLEAGIATVLAALHAARDVAFDGSADADDRGDGDDSETDAVTLRLLGELDRLWHQSTA